MAERHETSSSVGELLKDMALRSGSAFPDFDAVFQREKIRRHRAHFALAIGTSFAILCLAAGMGWSSLFPAKPMIEAWDGPSRGTEIARGGSSSQDPLVSYIEVLWNSSSDAVGSTR
ncbi:MAG: hypothetical protein NT061_10410 [Spirochaetes bacterium]|nr:hypothetical protein [Spirochaetota bacterium]